MTDVQRALSDTIAILRDHDYDTEAYEEALERDMGRAIPRWRLFDANGVLCDTVSDAGEVARFAFAMVEDGLAFSVEPITVSEWKGSDD